MVGVLSLYPPTILFVILSLCTTVCHICCYLFDAFFMLLLYFVTTRRDFWQKNFSVLLYYKSLKNQNVVCLSFCQSVCHSVCLSACLALSPGKIRPQMALLWAVAIFIPGKEASPSTQRHEGTHHRKWSCELSLSSNSFGQLLAHVHNLKISEKITVHLQIGVESPHWVPVCTADRGRTPLASLVSPLGAYLGWFHNLPVWDGVESPQTCLPKFKAPSDSQAEHLWGAFAQILFKPEEEELSHQSNSLELRMDCVQSEISSGQKGFLFELQHPDELDLNVTTVCWWSSIRICLGHRRRVQLNVTWLHIILYIHYISHNAFDAAFCSTSSLTPAYT